MSKDMFSVLYVDDEPLLLELAKLFLERDGLFTVDTIASAPAALTLLDSTKYDAIVSDYMIPDMDGIEFLKRVRTSGNNIPFILFTGRGREEVVIQALNEGADSYLQKGGDPVPRFTELSHKIHRVILQKKAETAVVLRESYLTAIIENQPGLVWLKDKESRFLATNQAFARSCGKKSSEELSGRTDLDVWPGELAEKYRADDARVIKQKKPLHVEEKIFDQKKITWFETFKMPVMDTTGQVIGTTGFARDITERKQAEEVLKESEEKFREIFDTINDGIHIHEIAPDGRPGKFIEVNEVACRMLQYTREELLEHGPLDFVAGYHNRPLEEIVREYSTNGQAIFETGHRRKDGTIVPVEIHNRVENLQGKRVIVSVVRDITERRKGERALEESEEKFRSFIEQALDGISLVDEDGRVIEWNTAQEKITGIPRTEALGVCAWDLAVRMIPDVNRREEIRSRIRESIQSTIKAGKSTHPDPVYFRFLRPDGSVAVARQTGFIVKTSQGHLVGSLSQDVTDQKRAEKKIMESEEKFRSLVEYSLEAILIVDFQGTVLLANKATALLVKTDDWLGLVGRNVMEFIAPESQEDVMKDFMQIAQGHDAYLAQYSVISAKGNKISVESIGKVISYEGRPADLISLRDITERKRAEDAVRTANRQLSLLTGITRHDILNKVSVILGFLKIAQMKTSDPALGEYLRKTEDATTAIRSQIEFTRVYQDLGTHEPQWIELDSIMPRSQVPGKIRLNAEVQGVLVFADPMLERVFFNLLDNSIRHGQRVTEIRVSSHRQDRDLVIVWEDNGIGIVENEKERIFERGFGKNTGLGMFLAREILSLTGITITETGEPGKGARFGILVPEGTFRLSGV